MFLYILRIGSLIVFSFNDHELKDVRYENEIKKLFTNNSVKFLLPSYGAHLLKTNIKSKLFVIKKNN